MAKNKDYIIGYPQIDLRNKESLMNYYVQKMLNEVSGMLEFTNLPESLPQRELRKILQTNGFACIPKPEFTNGQIYAFSGGLGGEPNPYYRPTICNVANPSLRLSKAFKIGEECAIIRHDSYTVGLLPIIKYYASWLVEHDVTMLVADINCRIPSIASASDDRTNESAKQYFKDIENGKLGIVFENGFLDGLKTTPYTQTASSGLISQLIEFKQYLKASYWNDVGVNANYNMKREAINSNESQLNDDALIPLVDDIITNVREGVDDVNKLLGTSIGVDLGSIWKDRQTIQDIELNQTQPIEEGENNETNV